MYVMGTNYNVQADFCLFFNEFSKDIPIYRKLFKKNGFNYIDVYVLQKYELKFLVSTKNI